MQIHKIRVNLILVATMQTDDYISEDTVVWNVRESIKENIERGLPEGVGVIILKIEINGKEIKL